MAGDVRLNPFRALPRALSPAILVALALTGCGGSNLTSSAGPSSGSTSAGAGATDDDWVVLFDGTLPHGLRGYGSEGDGLPPSWIATGGRLRPVGEAGVDLVTADVFGDFEVEFRWSIAPGGNSGVIYRVAESSAPSWASGPEYQILDDAGHPDGADPATSAGALYGLIAPGPDKRLARIGTDNEGRIVVRDGHVEHWLNGARIVAYDWRSEAVLALIAQSKFRDLPGFMNAAEGRVVFQHHGDGASFGWIRIRRL